ncbi:MAG TPA: PhzF family phenazine biosynthesis isomerase [Pseudonocardiaceae bacterium]|jgi:PhzF family phenazine biosynthesis protein|nr:PhzF family phenazine biosynthesis isomerase [Pseudonocardiaceae bacterium]
MTDLPDVPPGIEIARFAAFTTDPAGGNPAGVVLAAAGLSDAAMRRIAADVGYSETAFVTEGDDIARRYRLRYFSPLAEVPFCGHATVATAVATAIRIGPGPLVFDTAAGEIPVATDIGGGVPTATLTSVATSSRPVGPTELAAALAALRLSPTDLHAEFPPMVAFGGVWHLILAVGSRARLAELDYRFTELADVMNRSGWTTVHLFWPENAERFHARDPFPVGGVVEDPATGAAAAAFGGYLRDLGRIDRPIRLTVQQGADMGRPSELLIDVDPADPRVRVTGHAVPIN